MTQLPQGHHSLRSCTLVRDICKPLFDSTDISYFHHAELYDCAKISILTTHAEFHEHFWKHRYEKELFKQYYVGIFFNEPAAIPILRDGLQFGIDHILMIIVRHSNHYETFGFGTRPGNDAIVNFYLNHMDVLKKFTIYFREKGGDLIKAAQKNLLPVEGYSIREMKDFRKAEKAECYFNIKPKKIIIQTESAEVLVTAREFEILKLIAMGYSGKEIANTLHVVLKTVETHVSNIKRKLGCMRRSDLVKYFLKCPYA